MMACTEHVTCLPSRVHAPSRYTLHWLLQNTQWYLLLALLDITLGVPECCVYISSPLCLNSCSPMKLSPHRTGKMSFSLDHLNIRLKNVTPKSGNTKFTTKHHKQHNTIHLLKYTLKTLLTHWSTFKVLFHTMWQQIELTNKHLMFSYNFSPKSIKILHHPGWCGWWHFASPSLNNNQC